MTAFPRRLIVPSLLLMAAVTACAPRAAAPAPTEVAQVAATSTVPPTATRTQPPTATATVTPSPVPPTATNTPTPVPPTETPVPTATPTPGPGDLVYEASVPTDWDAWSTIYFGTDNFSIDASGSELTIQIDGADTYVYYGLDDEFEYADVQIDADVVILAGPNRNNLSLMCRYTEESWYEFNILSGGLWSIYKYDEVNGYRELKSGGSTAIQMGQSLNHLTAVCTGDTLTFYVNDVELGSARDATLTEGTFGMSASTFDISDLEVRFSDFQVRLADPNAELGAGVAPPVAPSGDSGEAAEDTYFVVPVPGDTLADQTLQFDILFAMFPLVQLAAPDGCEAASVTNTTVTQVVQPFAMDAQGLMVAGEWIEQWDVQTCGAGSSYRVEYQSDGAGGTNYRIQRAS